MTKPIAGAKRGARPQDDDKNLDKVADELASGNYTTFDEETETCVGGEPSYSLSGATRAVAAKLGHDDSHDGADRRRLSRKFERELKSAPEVPGEDGECQPRRDRIDQAHMRDAKAREGWLPDAIEKSRAEKTAK